MAAFATLIVPMSTLVPKIAARVIERSMTSSLY
jgi:hypothetical protein